MNQRAVSQNDSGQNTLLIDIATRNVARLKPSDSVGEAARIMAAKHISSIVVTDEEGHPAGIVTERDILQALRTGCPRETALHAVMSTPVITVPQSISCLDAYQNCLRDGIRHLVIVDDGKRLLGVISETDFRLRLNLTTLAGRRKIASVARRSAITLPPSFSLPQALDLMLAQHKSCAVVVEDDKPVGIITERDVVRFYTGEKTCADITLGQAMVSPVLTLPLEAPTSQAAEMMLAHNVRHLVVVDETGCMAGLVSEHELTQAMATGMAKVRSGIEEYYLRTLVNTLPDLVWLKDTDGVYLACNARVERFFGAKEKDIVGKTDYDLMGKDLADFFRAHDRKAMEKDGPSVNEEWVTFADDGHRELLETIKTPMRDSRGLLIGVLGIARDITGRRQLENKLEESERKFRNIFDSVGDCIEIISMDGRILDMNATGYERQGFTREEMVGKKLSEFAPPGNVARIAERMTLIKEQGCATFESGRLRKDGAVVPIEVSSRLIEMNGQPVFLGISRDISERKRTEDALRENEERLALATLHNGVGIWDWNLVTQEMIWDDSMYALYRIRREDFSGTEEAWRAALHPDDLKRGDQEVAAAIRGEKPFDTEFRVIWPSGEIRYIKAVAKVFRDEQGVPLRMLGTNVDITERRQAEEMLRKLSTAVEQSGASVVITDLDARIQYVNPRFTEATGYSANEAIGQNPRILQSGQTSKEAYEGLWGKLANGQEWNGELLNKRKNGELYWEEVSIAPVRNSQGIVSHYVAVKNEITERKRMEAALAESEHRYRMLIENSPFCIHEIDLKGRLQSMNPAGLVMMGLDDETKICGVPYLRAVGKEDKGRIKALLRDAVNGAPRHFEFAAAGGAPRYFKSCFIPIKDADGKVMKLMGITEDITRRKRDEDKLREQKEFLASIFENALDAVTMMDSKGVITGWSKQAEQIFGWSHEEAVGRPMHETIIPARYRNQHLRGLNHFRATGEGPALNKRIEISALHRDGHELPVELSISPIRTEHGYAFSSFIRDITASKRAEELLLKQKQFSDDVINSLPGIFYILDQQGHILRVNPQFQEVTGYAAAELQGMSALALFEGENKGIIEERIRNVFETGSAWVEAELSTKSGQTIPYYFSGHLTNIDGQSYLVGLGTDITERKLAELKLQQSEAHFRFISESAQALIWMSGMNRRCTWFNKVWLDFTGRAMEQELGNGWTEGVHPDDRRHCLDIYAGHFNRREPFGMEYRLRRHDGEYRWVLDNGSPRFNAQGVFEGYIGSCFDITDRKRDEENLRITASVFDTSQEAILITDANNRITEVNPAFTEITGYAREEVLGRNPKLLSSGRQDQAFYAAMWQTLKQEKAWRGEIWNRRKSGEFYAELLSISAICDEQGHVQRHVAVFSDISYLKEHEAALSRIAHYDALTGIPNRMLLADRMKQAIAQTCREQNMMAVCYLDLDGFKPVNDTLGHEAGDHVLIEIAKRLGNTIRGGDTVARLGGDEFVVLLLGLERGEECMATLERLLAAIALPIPVKNEKIALGASIGVSVYPLDDDDPDALLRHADQAMYIAKQSGKNRFHIYDPALDRRARDQQDFLKSIRHGLEHGQFELYYQPKVDLRTKALVGAEALIRWRHPERGLLLPAEFLRCINHTALDIEVGEWVTETALAQMTYWRNTGLDIRVSINLSAYHLESPGFLEKLAQQLSKYPDMPPDRFQFEVLETVELNDIYAVQGIIEACRKIGIGFALDDFGTGYSPLTYLSNLPVDALKIDQSFVRDMLEDKGDMAIVRSIIALAQAFDLRTIAEGIETMTHYQALLDMGCESGQGYVIARPMPADELANWRMD